MKNVEDQIYLDRIKNGDSSCYSFIVDKYKNMAYTIALKIMCNAEDAEDVAQESFVKAYQQIHRFKGKSKFSTWLYTIVYRTSISKLKEKKVETSTISDDISENYSPNSTTPQLEQLQSKEIQKYIKEAIQKLPRIDSLLITLYYVNENSIKEIQLITGLSSANIKVKLFRARKKLEQKLQFLVQHESKIIEKNDK